jgi:MOSC domain-containing protein YiiM
MFISRQKARCEIRLFGYLIIGKYATKKPRVISVSCSPVHGFSKDPVDSIKLIKGLGVEGDAHYGEEDQHLFRVKAGLHQPNLRQVHLLQSELLKELDLQPGDIGENVSTEGIDLLRLGRGTKLHFVEDDEEIVRSARTAAAIGKHALVEVTGLRNPCHQINKFRKGLQEKFVVRDEERNIVARKSGIMGVVIVGGEITSKMRIVVEEPETWQALDLV